MARYQIIRIDLLKSRDDLPNVAGERFYDLVRAEMPDKVIRSAVGTRFVFGA